MVMTTRQHECIGCICLKCKFKGMCHCPLKNGEKVPDHCDNFLTNKEYDDIIK